MQFFSHRKANIVLDLLRDCMFILLSFFLSAAAATIIAIWVGVFVMAIVIVAPVGALFGWMCLHRKKLEKMNDQV